MSFCFHCMTKLDSPDMPFCPECGKKHNSHQSKSYELPAGTMLSNERYIIGECINEDNFSLSYIGYDLKSDKKVVVKEIFYKNIFSRDTSQNDNKLNVQYSDNISVTEINSQISRECIALTELDTITNIAKVYDWFGENNTGYIINEFIIGQSLYERIEETSGFEWEQLYMILKPLLNSLKILHENNIFHKNIKPQNIIFRTNPDDTQELVLTDFGFACPTVEKGLSFESSSPYEPAEQRNHAQNSGEYTDIYSAAAMIYFAVTGQSPLEIASKNIDEPFPLLKPYRKEAKLPENVYYALKYALQPDYKNRCPSIETFMQRLDKVQKPVAVKSGNSAKQNSSDYADTLNPQNPTSPITENQNEHISQDNKAAPKKKLQGILIAVAIVFILIAAVIITAVLSSPEKNNDSAARSEKDIPAERSDEEEPQQDDIDNLIDTLDLPEVIGKFAEKNM